MKRILLGMWLVMSVWMSLVAQNQVEVYSAPEGVEMKDDFTVKVRIPGGEWKPVDTYMVKVDEVRGTKHWVEKASLAYFDFEGEVEVSVTANSGSIETGRVRPLSYGIVSVVRENTMTFKLDRPRNLSIEVNGDIFHNLHLFANPIDANKPKKIKKNKDLIYFGPGIHQLPNDSLAVPSGKTVYIAGGARVYGTLFVQDVRDVKIFGRGIVHPVLS